MPQRGRSGVVATAFESERWRRCPSNHSVAVTAATVLAVVCLTMLARLPSHTPVPRPVAPRSDVARNAAPSEFRRVIAFALYPAPGTRKLRRQDIAGLILNVAEARRWFGEWEVWLFVSDAVPSSVVKLATLMGVTVRRRSARLTGGGRAMTWRFEAADEPSVERVIVRDLDSRLNPRDRAAVQAWQDGGFACHAMRDHPLHRVPMMGGMWGCMRQALIHGLNSSVATAVDQFWESTSLTPWGNDQTFLAANVWPRVVADTLVHCSYNCGLDGTQLHRPFPEPPARTPDFFVGQRVEPDEMVGCGKDTCSLVNARVTEVGAQLVLTPSSPFAQGCSALPNPPECQRIATEIANTISSVT